MRFSRMIPAIGALLLLLWAAPIATLGAEPDPALRSYHAGNGFLNRGLNELAVKEYEAFLEQRPDHEKAVVARYGLGVALFRLNRFEESVRALTPLLQERSFEFAAEVDLLLGQARMSSGDFAAAAERFQSLLDRNSEHDAGPAAGALLVESLYRSDDHAGAERAADSFLQRWSDDDRRDRVRFFYALAAMSDDQYGDAADRFERLLDDTPQSPLANQSMLLAAQCRQQTNAFAEAARLYECVIERAEKALLPDALYGLATILQANDQSEDAARLLDEFLRLRPDDTRAADAKLRRAQIWFAQGRYDRAEAALRDAADDAGADAGAIAYWQAKCALRRERPAEAADLLDRALTVAPNHALAPEMQYDRAVALQRSGELDAARTALAQFQRQFPDHGLGADALALRASLAHQLEDYDDSADACEAFLRMNPNHPQAASLQYLLAENHYLAGELDDAAATFETFLRDNGDGANSVRARFRLGAIRYQQDDFDGAAAWLERVLRDAPGDDAFRSIHLMLGEIAFANRDWPVAAAHFEAYASESDAANRDQCLLKLGVARQRQDNFAGALRAYESLLNEYPDSSSAAHAHFERGQSLLALDRTDDAAEAFAEVLEYDDANRLLAPALNHLGAIAAQRGDHDDAIERFQRAVSLAEDDALRAEALNRLGRSFAAVGRSAEAASAFETLNRELPDNRFALEARARQALALAKSGETNAALAMIEELERSGLDQLDPRLAGALRYEKAWRLRESDRAGEASDTYETLLAGDISDDLRAHALTESADLAIASGNFADAARRLRDALELLQPGRLDNPDLRAGVEYRLGLALHRAAEHANAADLLERYLRSNHVDEGLRPAAHLMAGESLYQLSRHRQAATHFSAVIELSEDDEQIASSLLRLGECEAAGQRWAVSERAFAEYLDRFSDQSLWFQARFGQGWARENLGRHADAIEAYRDVVNRHEGQTAARAQFQIGECLFAQRELQDAVAEFLKVDVLYAYPEWSAAALYEAGRCFEALGQPAEARKQFQRVQDEFADTKWAPMAASRLAAVPASSLTAR